MLAQLASAAIGVWLMAAPTVLDYGSPAATSDRIAGPIIVSIGVIAASEVTRQARYALLPVGLWLVAAPGLLAYPAAAVLNSLLCGLAAAGLSFFKGTVEGRYGGGWASLLPGRRLGRDEE